MVTLARLGDNAGTTDKRRAEARALNSSSALTPRFEALAF